jgi:uncharacterized protein YwbE
MYRSLLQIQDAATVRTRSSSIQDAADGKMTRGSALRRSIESQPQRSPSRAAVALKPGAVGRMRKGMSLQRSMESQVYGGGVKFGVEM